MTLYYAWTFELLAFLRSHCVRVLIESLWCLCDAFIVFAFYLLLPTAALCGRDFFFVHFEHFPNIRLCIWFMRLFVLFFSHLLCSPQLFISFSFSCVSVCVQYVCLPVLFLLFIAFFSQFVFAISFCVIAHSVIVVCLFCYCC